MVDRPVHDEASFRESRLTCLTLTEIQALRALALTALGDEHGARPLWLSNDRELVVLRLLASLWPFCSGAPWFRPASGGCGASDDGSSEAVVLQRAPFGREGETAADVAVSHAAAGVGECLGAGCPAVSEGVWTEERVPDSLDLEALTQTLRSLERDGLLTRTVTPTVPVTVTYELTDLGLSLHNVMYGIKVWAEAHMDEVLTNRKEHDTRIPEHGGTTAPPPG